MDALDLGSASWVEAGRLGDERALGLWPVGSVEAHGPHLPLLTDLIISRAVAARAAAATRGQGYLPILIPELSFGLTHYAAEFTGTLGISGDTLRAIVHEVSADAGRHGLKRLCLVNNHLEPAHLQILERAARESSADGSVKVIAPNPCSRRWALTLSEEFKRGACHAGQYETSLVLAAQPALVRRDLAAELPPLPIDLAKAMRQGIETFREAGATQAYFGTPSAATVEEGNELLERLTTMVLTEIAEQLPL
jgi:creatinine amidohydrolase